MKTTKSIFIMGAVVSASTVLSGCATTETSVADGQSLKTILAAQINDVDATTRHGTTAPHGTDPDVSNTSVNSVRERSRAGTSKPGLMDLLFGGMGRN